MVSTLKDSGTGNDNILYFDFIEFERLSFLGNLKSFFDKKWDFDVQSMHPEKFQH